MPAKLGMYGAGRTTFAAGFLALRHDTAAEQIGLRQKKLQPYDTPFQGTDALFVNGIFTSIPSETEPSREVHAR